MSELAILAARAVPPPTTPTHTGTARNRYCADEVTLHLVVEGREVRAAGWSGHACEVCRASATRLCDLLHDPAPGALQALERALDHALEGQADGPFAPFAPLVDLPSRHPCARLPFEAARRALQGVGSPAPAPVRPAAPEAADAWASIEAYRAAGHDVALATLVDVVGSSPCPVGSHMVVADDGRFWGGVSGGCVEGAVVQAAVAMLRGDGRSRLATYRIANSQAGEVGLPCGGEVRIHIAPAPGDAALRTYRAVGRGLARVVELDTGREHLAPDDAERPYRDGGRFVQPLVGPHRLVLVGGTHIAQKLAALARPVGLEVVLVEPREGFAGPDRFGVPVHLGRPEHVLADLVDARTAVVMLSHDAALDDPGLRVALASDAFYVGALGSRKTQRARLERLAAAGVAPERLARLRGPAGLAIGAQGPGEIALSILAEVVAAKHAAEPEGIGCLVLAAGRSRRAGPDNKLLHPIDGVPMVRRAVTAAVDAALGPVVVVLGHEADAVRGVLDDLPVQFVRNPAHADGMGRSIAVGIEALEAHRVRAAFVVLGDMPWLRSDDLRRLARAHTRATQHLAIVPVAGEGDAERRGNPVLWPARLFDALRALRGDVGGKGILAKAPGAVLEVRIDHPGVLRDVDELP